MKFVTLNLRSSLVIRFRIGIVVIDWRIIIFHTRILTFCQSFIFFSAGIIVTGPSAAIQETQKEQNWQQHSVETLSQRDLTRPSARLTRIYTRIKAEKKNHWTHELFFPGNFDPLRWIMFWRSKLLQTMPVSRRRLLMLSYMITLVGEWLILSRSFFIGKRKYKETNEFNFQLCFFFFSDESKWLQNYLLHERFIVSCDAILPLVSD